jgi:hydroxypyruvate isomerase
MGAEGDDFDRAFVRYGDRIVHVQIADSPGRPQPDVGALKLAWLVEEIQACGSDLWVAREHGLSGTTADSFGWLSNVAQGPVSALKGGGMMHG